MSNVFLSDQCPLKSMFFCFQGFTWPVCILWQADSVILWVSLKNMNWTNLHRITEASLNRCPAMGESNQTTEQKTTKTKWEVSTREKLSKLKQSLEVLKQNQKRRAEEFEEMATNLDALILWTMERIMAHQVSAITSKRPRKWRH